MTWAEGSPRGLAVMSDELICMGELSEFFRQLCMMTRVLVLGLWLTPGELGRLCWFFGVWVDDSGTDLLQGRRDVLGG